MMKELNPQNISCMNRQHIHCIDNPVALLFLPLRDQICCTENFADKTKHDLHFEVASVADSLSFPPLFLACWSFEQRQDPLKSPDAVRAKGEEIQEWRFGLVTVA